VPKKEYSIWGGLLYHDKTISQTAVPALFFGPGHITMRSTWKANLAFVLAGFLLSVVPGIALAAALTA